MAQTKTCPYCNRPVPFHIPKCPYCGKSLNEKKTTDKPRNISTKNARLNAILHGEQDPEDEIPVASMPEEIPNPKNQYEDIPLSELSPSPIKEEVHNTATVPILSEEPAQSKEPQETYAPENHEPEPTPQKTKKKEKEKKKSLFGRRHSDHEDSDEAISSEEVPQFDANADGYYDDVLPALAEQINRLPKENVIKIIFIVIAVIIILAIAFWSK